MDILLRQADQAQRRRALPRPQRQDREDRRRQGQAAAASSRPASTSETAKKIQTLIKQSKLKVQASIQGDTVRVTGAKRDDLQAAMALLRKEIADLPLSFNNFRD